MRNSHLRLCSMSIPYQGYTDRKLRFIILTYLLKHQGNAPRGRTVGRSLPHQIMLDCYCELEHRLKKKCNATQQHSSIENEPIPSVQKLELKMKMFRLFIDQKFWYVFLTWPPKTLESICDQILVIAVIGYQTLFVVEYKYHFRQILLKLNKT